MYIDNNERMASFLKDMAILARSFFDNLKAQGFTDEQAMILVAEWEKAMLGVGTNKSE